MQLRKWVVKVRAIEPALIKNMATYGFGKPFRFERRRE